MIRHYFTLEKLVEELQILVGSELLECFSQDKNTCVLCFSVGTSLNHVYISVDSHNSFCYLIEEFHRAKKNTVSIFQDIIGETLQSVRLIKYDRIICFEIINTFIYVKLYGGSQSSIIVCNKNNVIIDSLNFGREFHGTTYISKEIILPKFICQPKDISLSRALKNSEFLLGTYYTEELLLRLNLKDLLISELSQEKINIINDEANKIITQCRDARKFYLLKSKSGVLVLSLILLQKFPEIFLESNSISELIKRKFVSQISEKSLSVKRNELLSSFERKIKRLSSTIAHTQKLKENSPNSANYRLYADLLSSIVEQKSKNIDSIELPNYEGNILTIKLNPKLSINENRQHYYDKAKRAIAEAEIRTHKLPKLILDLKYFESMKLKIEKTENMKEFDSLKKELSNEAGVKDNEPTIKSSKYRVFELSEGFLLYIGKSAANNDELTMKFAKPNDIWMHVRGSAGSHAVIRVDKGKPPNKSVIREAAEIVAYYSQARRAKYVPVAYCERKNVRKPKGSAPGSVEISREEIIMAEPKISEK